MNRSDRTLRLLLPLALLLGLLAGTAGPRVIRGRAAPQYVPGGGVVISEFRTLGPIVSPATDPVGELNEFIEIFNRTAAPVDISGWSLMLVSTGTGGLSTTVPFGSAGTIGPGERRLIVNSQADPALTGDWSYTGDLPNNGGIALRNASNQTIDSVALSNIPGYLEGTTPLSPMGTGNAAQSYQRIDAACTDNNNNSADLTLSSTVDPQGSTAGATPCATLYYAATVSIGTVTPNSSPVGTAYTVNFTVAAPAGPGSIPVPAGNVTVSDGTATCTGTVASGSCSLTSTTVGGKNLVATYAGDATNYVASSSPPVPHQVTQMGTTTSITSDNPDPSPVNGAYIVQYTVSPAQTSAVSPAGAVTVSDGTASCSATVAAGQCSLTSTTAGAKTLTATYSGDSNFQGSVSATVTHTVTAAAATPTPLPTQFTVVINEVAWSGTRADADHEWIELYNRSGRDIDLSGWYIQVTSFDRIINLSPKILPAGGYYLIERDEAATTVTADQVDAWEPLLEDDFEILSLFAPTTGGSRLIDQTYVTRSQWPAGSVTNARSMERRVYTTVPGAVWVTYAGTHVSTDPKDVNGNFINGTPGRANWNLSVTLTPSATPTRIVTRVPTRTKPPQPRPVINEFLPRANFDWNQDGRVDVYDEFVEVANIGPADWNTGGWRMDTGEDSETFVLPQTVVKPGGRALFYGRQSGLRLTDGGATLRLLSNTGVIYDAQTYTVVKTPDKSWCRMKDLSGSWFDDCFPTPNLPNSREGALPALPPGTGLETPLCRLADTLPEEFVLAECNPYGEAMWNSRYWDLSGWTGEQMVPQAGSKWEIFIE